MENTQKNLKSENDFKLEFFLFILIPSIVIALIKLITIVPYIGFLFQIFYFIIVILIFSLIGVIGSTIFEEFKLNRKVVLGFVFISCTLAFVTQYVIGFYIFPIKMKKQMSEESHINVTYKESAEALRARILKETGGTGILAFSIYSERLPLNATSYKEFIKSELEDIDDFLPLLTAIINITLQSIPMLFKWILCDKLGLIREAGWVGLVFWYIFSLTLAYFGWKKSSQGSDDEFIKKIIYLINQDHSIISDQTKLHFEQPTSKLKHNGTDNLEGFEVEIIFSKSNKINLENIPKDLRNVTSLHLSLRKLNGNNGESDIKLKSSEAPSEKKLDVSDSIKKELLSTIDSYVKERTKEILDRIKLQK